MKKYDITLFKKKFLELGIEECDIILVHNSLLSFGLPNNLELKHLPKFIFDSLFSIVGNEGTIVVPTFNFDFCKGVAFNRQDTPSKNMGVFSEYVRQLPQSKRSYHPMQSVAVVGNHTDYLTEKDTMSSFSDEGPFDRLLKLNAKVLLLGADINSVSMIHWVEERANVPYRYWKTFRANYIEENIETEKEYKLFVRDMELNPKLKLDIIENFLIENNKILIEQIGNGYLKRIFIADFVKISKQLIENNPYYFVSNHENFEKR